jgi:predicted nicotinamide N-methyase
LTTSASTPHLRKPGRCNRRQHRWAAVQSVGQTPASEMSTSGGGSAPTDAPAGLQAAHYIYSLGCDGEVAIRVRELCPLARDDGAKAFRERAKDDVTGWTVWGSAVVLSRWLLAHRDSPAVAHARHAVELGSGCGLSGIVAARHACPALRRLALTDYNATTLGNLRFNAAANGLDDGVACVAAVDWDDEASFPSPPADAPGGWDLVLCSDATYRRSYARKLFVVVDALLAAGGTFVYASPQAREGLPMLLSLLDKSGWAVTVEEVPPDWRTNPLASGACDAGAGGAVTAVADAPAPGGATDGLFPELFMRDYPLVVVVARKPPPA